MKSPLVIVSHLWKTYRMDGLSFDALRDISLRIETGEFVAIMGPSGSGKSTLMHCIGCLESPSSGTVSIEKEDVSHLSDKSKARLRNQYIGFIFQQFHLLRKTSAVANVEMPLLYAGIGSAKRRERAINLLQTVGLQDKINNFPSQLSGGQQQRVAIARALVTNPRILLADEPTGNLDSASGEDIMKLLTHLHTRGHTIVVVTHDARIAEYARRVIQIVDGRIVSDSKRRT